MSIENMKMVSEAEAQAVSDNAKNKALMAGESAAPHRSSTPPATNAQQRKTSVLTLPKARRRKA